MSRRRQSVNIIPGPGSSGQQQPQHPAYAHPDNSAPSLNYNPHHRRVSSAAGCSGGGSGGGSNSRHLSIDNVRGAGSPDRSGDRKQLTAAKRGGGGRRHSANIDPRAIAEVAALRGESANITSNRQGSMPRTTSFDRILPAKMPSQINIPGVDGDGHIDSTERVRRSSSEGKKDQLPAKYNRFDKTVLQQDSRGGDSRRSSQNDQLPAKYNRFDSLGLKQDSHGGDSRRNRSDPTGLNQDSRNSDSFGSSNNSGSLRGNRKQVKNNRDNDLRSLAELGLELQEERSGDGGSDVANVEPSTRPNKKKTGDGDAALATDSARNLDIDLNSVEAKAIIKLQKQLKNVQGELKQSHQKNSELSLDNAERGVQIHQLTQEVKDLLALNEQAKLIRAENEALQRMVKRGEEESAKVEVLRQDNDMLRREIDKLRLDNKRLADQRGDLKNEIGYLRKECDGASGDIAKLRADKNEMKKEIGFLRNDREAMKDKVGRMTGKVQKLEGDNRNLVSELAKTRNMLEKTDRALRAQEDLLAAKAAASSVKHNRSTGTRSSIRAAPPSASAGVITSSLAPGLGNDTLRRPGGRRPMG